MDLDFILKVLFFFIVNGFGLVVFWSFRYFKIGKKDNEYTKVIETFGLKKKYEEIRGKKVERKPSTVLKRTNYMLPLVFFTVTSTILSSIFLFPAELFSELFEEIRAEDGTLISSAKTFAHNPFFMGMSFGHLDISELDIDALNVMDLQRRSIATLAWGFIGAFLWSASNMVRRLSKADITPILYYKSSFRMLFACAVALIFSFISGKISLGTVNYTTSLVPAVAFLAGMLPERFFNYLMEMLKTVFSGKDVNTDTLHLRHIEGISSLHRERLWEEGIDNVQNLAQASLMQLLLKTPFEARQILDWIGQAKLLGYMKDDIGRAHAVGIRSAFDLVSLKETYTKKGLDNMAALQELGQSSGMSTPKLAVVSELINEDLGICSLKGFMDKLNGKKEVAVLYDNVEVEAPSNPEVNPPSTEATPKSVIPDEIPKSYD